MAAFDRVRKAVPRHPGDEDVAVAGAHMDSALVSDVTGEGGAGALVAVQDGHFVR